MIINNKYDNGTQNVGISRYLIIFNKLFVYTCHMIYPILTNINIKTTTSKLKMFDKYL